MSLMSGCVVTNPSSFEETTRQRIWVDAIMEEYDSIVHNSLWDVVQRPEDNSVVRSCWLYKLNKAADGSMVKIRLYLWHVAFQR